METGRMAKSKTEKKPEHSDLPEDCLAYLGSFRLDYEYEI